MAIATAIGATDQPRDSLRRRRPSLFGNVPLTLGRADADSGAPEIPTTPRRKENDGDLRLSGLRA